MNKLLCNNFILECFKEYDLVELRVFYNLINHYRVKCMFTDKVDDLEDLTEEDRLLSIDKEKITDLFRNVGRKTFDDIKNLMINLPPTISYTINGSARGKIGVYEQIEYNLDTEEFEILFTQRFSNIIFEVANFSEMDLSNLQKIKGKQTFRMYELYVRMRKLKFYKMTIETLYNYFEYAADTRFYDIEKVVFKKGIDDLNKILGNNKIKYEKIKKNRKVTHIQFYFS